ncbi:galectin-4-like [Hoplias malabaricus]|uniref:galectin-4-like n=1 Tax=Hoplias malabaricus TaxID=27720 RepID=UPI003463114C
MEKIWDSGYYAKKWAPCQNDPGAQRRLNENIPYVGKIPGDLKPGMAFYFQGVVHPDASRFNIHLKSGQNEDDDIAFHFNPRMNSSSTVFNSRRNGQWENEETFNWCPTPKGSAFDIFFVISSNSYEKWNASTFHKELCSGTSRCKQSNIQSEVTSPICSPDKPYNAGITGELQTGRILYFQGVVPSDCDRFAINLKCGPEDADDIAFHFNPRLSNSSVVRNSFRNGSWGMEEISEGPFVKGGAFDLFIFPEHNGYVVVVNGHVLCTFKHRIPLEKVSFLNINGDVFINVYGFAEGYWRRESD